MFFEWLEQSILIMIIKCAYATALTRLSATVDELSVKVITSFLWRSCGVLLRDVNKAFDRAFREMVRVEASRLRNLSYKETVRYEYEKSVDCERNVKRLREACSFMAGRCFNVNVSRDVSPSLCCLIETTYCTGQPPTNFYYCISLFEQSMTACLDAEEDDTTLNALTTAILEVLGPLFLNRFFHKNSFMEGDIQCIPAHLYQDVIYFHSTMIKLCERVYFDKHVLSTSFATNSLQSRFEGVESISRYVKQWLYSLSRFMKCEMILEFCCQSKLFGRLLRILKQPLKLEFPKYHIARRISIAMYKCTQECRKFHSHFRQGFSLQEYWRAIKSLLHYLFDDNVNMQRTTLPRFIYLLASAGTPIGDTRCPSVAGDTRCANRQDEFVPTRTPSIELSSVLCVEEDGTDPVKTLIDVVMRLGKPGSSKQTDFMKRRKIRLALPRIYNEYVLWIVCGYMYEREETDIQFVANYLEYLPNLESIYLTSHTVNPTHQLLSTHIFLLLAQLPKERLQPYASLLVGPITPENPLGGCFDWWAYEYKRKLPSDYEVFEQLYHEV